MDYAKLLNDVKSVKKNQEVGCMTRFSKIVADWENNSKIKDLRVDEPIAACYARTDMNDNIMTAIKIDNLYSHQALSYKSLQAGKSILLSTPTASGKTLCFLPSAIADALYYGKTTLLVYPLKALMTDQVGKLEQINARLGNALKIGVWSGDTMPEERSRIFSERVPDILAITPDALHHLLAKAGTMYPIETWKLFLKRLGTVVVDEAHTYRGSFGSHVVNLFRRLRLGVDVCGGESPFIKWVISTATLGNPLELGSLLSGYDESSFELIDESGAATHRRTKVILDSNGLGRSRTVIEATLKCLSNGLSILVFCNSRYEAKTLAMRLGKQWINPNEIVFFHGSLKNDRRNQIIEALAEGEIKCIVSTCALEAGLDLPNLDCVILSGFSDSIMSLKQRIGRCARNREGLVVIVPSGEAILDNYYTAHPDEFYAAQAETLACQPDYPIVLSDHILCAASEQGIEEKDYERFGKNGAGTIRAMLTQKALLKAKRGYLYATGRPHKGVSLRGSDLSSIAVTTQEGEILEEVSITQAIGELHPSAIYQIQDEGETFSYRVESLDLVNKRAIVELLPDNTKSTRSIVDTEVTPKSRISEFKFIELKTEVGATPAKLRLSMWWGSVNYTVVGYKEIVTTYEPIKDSTKLKEILNESEPIYFTDEDTGEKLIDVDLSQTFQTAMLVIETNSGVNQFITGLQNSLRAEYEGFINSKPLAERDGFRNFATEELIYHNNPLNLTVHGLSHILLKSISTVALATQQDIVAVMEPGKRKNSDSSVYLFDNCQNGNGTAQVIYDQFEKLVSNSLKLAASCPCKNLGCPRCLYLANCPDENKEINKLLGMKLLDMI